MEACLQKEALLFDIGGETYISGEFNDIPREKPK